jgi:hypothetical protein
VECGAETSQSLIFLAGWLASPKSRRIGAIGSMRCSPTGMVQSETLAPPPAGPFLSGCSKRSVGGVVRDSALGCQRSGVLHHALNHSQALRLGLPVQAGAPSFRAHCTHRQHLLATHSMPLAGIALDVMTGCDGGQDDDMPRRCRCHLISTSDRRLVPALLL